MGLIELEIFIKAPPERCFDLSRSVDLHLESTRHTQERAVAGVTSGLLQLGDQVTWEARHFGIRQRLRIEISAYDRPHSFQDRQVAGVFQSFQHEHLFIGEDGGTRMRDRFQFACPWGFFGKMADPVVARHLFRFLNRRNQQIKRVAESEDWKRILNPS